MKSQNNKIYDQIGIPSIKHHRTICKLTEQLKLCYGIDRFWRNSHKTDGSYSVLGNHPPVAESFFGQQLFLGHPYFRNPIFFKSGFSLPELLSNEEYEATQGRLRGEGDCHHVLIHIQKNDDGFVEYGFATSKAKRGFEAIYLNHLHAISTFIKFFESNAAKIIREADDFRIDISKVIGPKYQERPRLVENLMVPEKDLLFYASIDSDPYKKHALLSLTKSEKICLRHYLMGHTTQEIAKLLFRSPRTIETHLENAKSKLGVHSRSALFEILIPYREYL